MSELYSIREPMLFEKMLDKDLAKYQMRAKMFLKIAGFSTIFAFLLEIAIGLLGKNLTPTSPITAILGTIFGIACLGIFTWPLWLYYFIRRANAKKLVTELPPPGKARLEYAIHRYEKKHWERLPSEEKGEIKIMMQKKKPSNIFTGLFIMLFGLIGYFSYAKGLKKTRPIIELSLTEEGFVKIV
jgi:hypothetical protein